MPGGLPALKARVAAVVDPAHVEGVAGVGQVDDGEVKDEVGEAASGVRVALYDAFEPFDDGSTAELNVSLDGEASGPGHCGGPEDEQRRGVKSFVR